VWVVELVTAVEEYVARVLAVAAQRARLGASYGLGTVPPRFTDAVGGERRPHPDQRQEPELLTLARHLEPDEVLVDVGGGSGRLGLALAARCRQVVNVERSADRLTEFAASAAAAGIDNVRVVQGDWLNVAVSGDVVLAAHVTYAAPDIRSFVERLQVAARRRVLILLYEVPAEAQALYQAAHQLVFGEAPEVPPGYRELLPVLWELGVLPEVQVLGKLGTRATVASREAAVERVLQSISAVSGVQLAGNQEACRRLLEHADDLFVQAPDGFRPAPTPNEEHRGVLISWPAQPSPQDARDQA